MRFTLAFSHTALEATVWRAKQVVATVQVPFRQLPAQQGLTICALLSALETAFTELAGQVDFADITAINGVVPHPTSLAAPTTFPHFALDPALPAAQVDDFGLLDPFHPWPPDALASFLPGSLLGGLKSYLACGQRVDGSRIVPLGAVLGALLCGEPGVTAEEAAVFLGCHESEVDRAATTSPFDLTEPSESLGVLSSYWQDRWGLPAIPIYPFITSAAAIGQALLPGPRDLIMVHDNMDLLLAPKSTLLLSVQHDVSGKATRTLVRDKYANGRWDTLAYLALRFAPGGSIGLDDKRFAVISPNSPDAPVAARFELGEQVDEFSDLRANTRCILEGQVFQLKLQVGDFRPERIILVSDEDSGAMAHLLATVFEAPVVLPNEAHLRSLGALLAMSSHAQGDHYKPTQPAGPLTPMVTGDGDSNCATRAQPAIIHVSRPPSPPEAPLVTFTVAAEPGDLWERKMYQSMLSEYERVRERACGQNINGCS